MSKKLYIVTHGCQMNEYDSARMRDLLGERCDMVPAESPDEADVLLLNTCSIREKAQEKVFHQLGRWKRLKQRNPDLIIGVGGCVASQEGEEIGRREIIITMVFAIAIALLVFVIGPAFAANWIKEIPDSFPIIH